MDELTAIRKEAKKYIDKADDKTLEIIFRILESSDEKNEPLINMTAAQSASFKRGVKEANERKLKPHKDIMKKYQQWLTK